MLKKLLVTLAAAASLALPEEAQTQSTAGGNTPGYLQPQPSLLPQLFLNYDREPYRNAFRAAIEVSVEKKKTFDVPFILFGGALAGAKVYDIESTHIAKDECERAHAADPFYRQIHTGCYETNPVTRPFFEAGRVPHYAALMGFNAGLMYLSDRMRRSPEPLLRKIWPILPIVFTSFYVYAGTTNLNSAAGYGRIVVESQQYVP